MNKLIPGGLSFQVDEETGLPPGLCYSCTKDTLSSFHFRRLCKNSCYTWSQAVESLSFIQEPTDEDKTYYVFYNSGVQTIIRDQVFAVKTASEALERLSTKIKNEDALRLTKKVRTKNESPKKQTDKIKRKCPYCGKGFSLASSLNQHLKTANTRTCTQCTKILHKRDFRNHLFKAHNVTLFICDTCYEVFDLPDKLEAHVLLHNVEGVHCCNSCGQIFANQRALRAHSYAHNLFHCPGCSVTFENRKCYKYHIKICKKIPASSDQTPVYICDDCGAIYDKKPSLKIHIVQKHLNVLPFQCQTCGKRASTLAHLRSHETVHSAERKTFLCHCGSQFRTNLGFQLHQRIHSGERPYECLDCGERFLSASRRLDHIKRKHRSTKDMPHACEQCPARFIRPFELKKHYLTIHDTKVDVKHLKKTILEETLYPSGACVVCTKAILFAQEFITFVRNSETTWRRAITSLDTLPDSILQITPAQSIYAFVKKDNLSVQVVKDNAGIRSPKDIVERLTRTVPAKKKVRKPRFVRSGPSCSCKDCGTHFLSPYYLKLHLKNSGQKDACHLCGAIVLRGQQMKDHLETAHRQHSFLCPSCPALYEIEDDLKFHVKTAHKPGALTCGDCGRSFARPSGFEAHSQMHACRTCRSCGAQFTNRACYRKHRSQCEPTAKPDLQSLPRSKRSNVRDPATYICDHCGKTYHSRPQLKNHIIWIHMNVRPHQCQWCGKRFYTPARLAEHSIVHTRARNFECDICGAKLVSKMAVVYHRRRHTGEKPYECPDCGETFLSASRRTEHAKRRHNKGSRLHCMDCPASFVRGHELKKHVEKLHSTVKPVNNISVNVSS